MVGELFKRVVRMVSSLRIHIGCDYGCDGIGGEERRWKLCVRLRKRVDVDRCRGGGGGGGGGVHKTGR